MVSEVVLICGTFVKQNQDQGNNNRHVRWFSIFVNIYFKDLSNHYISDFKYSLNFLWPLKVPRGQKRDF